MKKSTSVQKLTVFMTSAAIVALGSVSQAEAALITSSSDPVLSGANVIDFESVTPGSYTSLTVDDVNFSTSNGELEFVDSAYAGSYNTQGQSLKNSYDPNAFTSLKIDFLSSVTEFGFNWGASDFSWTLTAFDAFNNVLDSQFLAPTFSSNAGDFVGIKNVSSTIKYATLVASSPGDYIFVDNFKYTATAVPEPGVIGGLAVLGAMGFWMKKKKAIVL